MVRHGDIDGSEIPGRYLGFLRGGPAEPLAAVVRHRHDQDVRSLARLLVLLADGYGTPEARRKAPAGDLGGSGAGLRAGRTPERGARVLRRRLRRRSGGGPGGATPAGRAADPGAAVRPATRAETHRGRAVVVASHRRPISEARLGRDSGLRRRSAPLPSPLRGRPIGSPSSEPICCAGSDAGTTQPRPGRASPPGRAGPRSWPPSNSPSCANTVSVIRSVRCGRPATVSPSPSDDCGSDAPSRASRPTCGPAPDGSAGVSSGGPRPQPARPTMGRARVGGLR